MDRTVIIANPLHDPVHRRVWLIKRRATTPKKRDLA